jgi:hypothetical protein
MVLDELDLSEVAQESSTEALKLLISTLFWTWFQTNQDHKITTVKWWFIRKTIYVKDLEGVFELLFGLPKMSQAGLHS